MGGGIVRGRALLVLICATLVATNLAAGATAPDRASGPAASTPKKQPAVPGFFRGRTIRYFDFGPIKLKPGNKLAPIWVVTNGASGQHNIVDTVPGRANYSPLWQVQKVTWADGVTPRVLRSAAEVRSARASGELTIERTSMVVNCPVLGFGQVRHPGFSRGKTIHYYDLGPVKVKPGNEVLPLWTVTNGVKRQLNIADVTPGQTAYPPLWAIIKVTWKPGAPKRLLTSLAAIRRAQAARQVTLTRTSLVVNCPLV
jgi:hypothetical protein